jgi:hypothetical protein
MSWNLTLWREEWDTKRGPHPISYSFLTKIFVGSTNWLRIMSNDRLFDISNLEYSGSVITVLVITIFRTVSS